LFYFGDDDRTKARYKICASTMVYKDYSGAIPVYRITALVGFDNLYFVAHGATRTHRLFPRDHLPATQTLEGVDHARAG